MPRPEGVPPPLTLYGCWDVCSRMGNPPHIIRQIDLLEDAVATQPGLALDASKALIESVCKTILDERAVTYDAERLKLNALVQLALDAVRLVPEGLPNALGNSMRALAGGLLTVAQRLGELRNKGGLIGHGRGAQERFIESTHALYAARATDALVHLLYVAHEDEGVAVTAGPQYGDYEAFDVATDEAHPVEIYDVPFRASEILFRLDPIGYQERLTIHTDTVAFEVQVGEMLDTLEAFQEQEAVDSFERADAADTEAREEAAVEAALAVERNTPGEAAPAALAPNQE